MKSFVRALALLALIVMPAGLYAQTLVADGINFKGATNVFSIHHSTGAPTSSCTGTTQYVQDDDATGNPFWVCKSGTMVHLGGIPTLTANQGVAANGSGALATTPEKEFSTGGGVTSVACDEDHALGKFDPRCTTYAGGVYGGTPGAAWQAFSDALVCYESMVGKHPHVQFPPGTFAVGTDAYPTLKLPSGGIYMGGGGWGFGTNATQFQATYNNQIAVEFVAGLTSTSNCSDGAPHTASMGGGSYDGFSEHGCGQGGCKNVPGDGGNYPFGGPSQIGILLQDPDSTIGKSAGIFANDNGADGVLSDGQDSHSYEVGGAANNAYFYFGLDVAGQNYQFSSGECHAEVVYGGLDGMNEGPTETYGAFMTPGWEYGHVAGICWGGGLTNLGHYFSQLEEIGVIHMAGGNDQASADSGRIDAPAGVGIFEQSNGQTTWTNPRVISACRFNGAGANSYLVYSVAIATAGSGQTPGTYLLTGSDGHSQISVTVAAGGTVTAAPIVTVHSRGMTSTAPTFTLAAGGTPATFTVTMQPVFELLHEASGSPAFTACDYIDDQSGANNVWISPLMVNNGFFGTDYSTGDVVTPSQPNTWVTPQGNAANKNIVWDPNPAALGSFYTGGSQRIVRADPSLQGGGQPVSGSAINMATSGAHIKMSNGSATALTTITGATIMEDLWITGDGFTTMPFANQGDVGTVFGATTCSQHNLLLNAGQVYHFIVTNGLSSGTQPKLTEICDSIFLDYLQPGFNWLAANSALPATTTQATMDVAGSYAVRPYPALPALTISTAGGGSSFTYCIAVEVWVAGGKETTPPVCNSHTPPLTTGPTDNFQIHMNLPQNWTRYKVFLNSTTDPGFTPGVWYDVTTPNGLPQAVTCDFSNNCLGGLFIEKKTPTDTSTIATANLSLNMTGTYNFDPTNLPASSSTLCVQGQVKIDPTVSTGAMYYCASEDHWVKAPLVFATF